MRESYSQRNLCSILSNLSEIKVDDISMGVALGSSFYHETHVSLGLVVVFLKKWVNCDLIILSNISLDDMRGD